MIQKSFLKNFSLALTRSHPFDLSALFLYLLRIRYLLLFFRIFKNLLKLQHWKSSRSLNDVFCGWTFSIWMIFIFRFFVSLFLKEKKYYYLKTAEVCSRTQYFVIFLLFFIFSNLLIYLAHIDAVFNKLNCFYCFSIPFTWKSLWFILQLWDYWGILMHQTIKVTIRSSNNGNSNNKFIKRKKKKVKSFCFLCIFQFFVWVWSLDLSSNYLSIFIWNQISCG